MGGSSGYRRLKGRSDDFLLQTYRQTDTSPLYIYRHRHHHDHIQHCHRHLLKLQARQAENHIECT